MSGPTQAQRDEAGRTLDRINADRLSALAHKLKTWDAMAASIAELRHHIVFDFEGDLSGPEFDAMLARADSALAGDAAAVNLVADAQRYRRIRKCRKFVGMLEFATAHADTDAEYDAGVDSMPDKEKA